MTQTKDLLNALKKCLRAKGLTYSEIAEALDLSESSVKRIFSEQTFSVSRLEEVCRFLNMSIYDLVRMARLVNEDEATRLTMEQELGLAKDPLVLTYFYLLLTGRSPESIAEEFGLDTLQQTTMLVRLSRLKLVELYPNNSGRLLTGRRIDWRHNGPIRKLYQRQVQEAFNNYDFDGEDEVLKFETGELSDASIKVLGKKLDRLSRDFDELADLDISTPAAKKRAYGLMIGFRLWTFWQILEGTANNMGLTAERSRGAAYQNS